MSIIRESEQYVSQLLIRGLSPDHRYHNLLHTLGVLESCRMLAGRIELEPADQEVLELAALFHDTGFTGRYRDHESLSMQIAEEFLRERTYPEDQLRRVLDCIRATIPARPPENQLQAILKDADLNNLGRQDYLATLAHLRHEWEVFFGDIYDDEEWYRMNENFLKQHQYYTEAANRMYAEQLEENRKRLKRLVKKNKKKKDDKTGDTIATNRSAQMMFKTALRNHLDLSNLADNKANIMLSINALLITVAMPLGVPRIADFPFLAAPMAVLVLTCLVSMVFATLATRPIKMSGETKPEDLQQGRSNLFFFGNFFRMSFDEYRQGLRHVVAAEDQLESAIMRDLYFLGLSLGRKYRQLRICYNIFLGGIILTVLALAVSYSVM